MNLGIDRIFYINLDKRPERNHNVRSELNKHNLLNITERVPAVDGSQLNLDAIPEMVITSDGIGNAKSNTKCVGISLTPGAIGCAMSHRKIWLKIRDDPSIQSALILEDDIQLDKDFMNKLKYYLNNAREYDVIFIGYHPATLKYVHMSDVGNLWSDTLNNHDIFRAASKVYGLFGYIVTKTGATKLLKIFPITDQIDTEMSNKLGHFGVKTILVKPDLRIVSSEPSEIATTFGTDIQVKSATSEIKENFTTEYFAFDLGHIVIFILIAIFIVLVMNAFTD